MFLIIPRTIRFSCGNNVHLHCMKMWAEYQNHPESAGRLVNKDADISCPVCRGKFCSNAALRLELLAQREYANRKNISDVPSTNNTAPHSSGNNLGNSLPMISVQSMSSLSGCSKTVMQLPEDAQTISVQETYPTRELVKEIRISMSKPKPGSQCFQCLSFFQKGTIVYQLPCRHLFHKECTLEMSPQYSCTICQQPFSLPREKISSAPPTIVKEMKKRKKPIAVTLPPSESRQKDIKNIVDKPEERLLFFNQLQIGEAQRVSKVQIKPTMKPVKTRFPTGVGNRRLESDQRTLPMDFCLTANTIMKS